MYRTKRIPTICPATKEEHQETVFTHLRFPTRTLLKALILIALLLPALNGCASLLDGKYVTRDGKDGPFHPMTDRYAPPKDPTARF
jgi:hypothetical protein